MLPISYAIRNLLRDPGRLLQKVGGAGIVVFLVFAAGAFNQGMHRILSASGSPQNVILLGAGSEESVERSEVPIQAETLAAAGIQDITTRLGVSAVSGEVHYMAEVIFPTGHKAQALLRGVTPTAFEVHRSVRILKGKYPKPGEVLVGKLAHHNLGVSAEMLSPGQTIKFEGQSFTVAGIFTAPGTVMESELWFDRNDLMTLTQREQLSCVVVRLESPESYASADLFSKQRLDLELSAIRESDYYAKLSAFYAPIRTMTWLTAALIAAGAIFGGLNMQYAAFASRIRELATLQAIGYSRPAIYLSLVEESLLATLLGTLLAVAMVLIFLEGQTLNFSMGVFRLTLSGEIALAGLLTGLLLGIIGSITPAIRCLGTSLPSALRS
ncbi:ABC transporter permease [Cerasicoccus arenae]|uniref:ABC transporter substrate-binding protein n=1 Tax=Cerasicoccus arenae TaxID=424488 RepID=A0A8J3DBA4_9BACT|nr:ABC transporter permease [Cerasicoccus arenae]MBK1857271.1 ABC transporter permease [Cerasicoccus arenae]GHC00389.1 ABC transporter substrate-binding protein [Cerasicoccus arenae]